jgi:hypothetical protein
MQQSKVIKIRYRSPKKFNPDTLFDVTVEQQSPLSWVDEESERQTSLTRSTALSHLFALCVL